MKQIIVTIETNNRNVEAVLAKSLQQHIFEAVRNVDGEIRAYSVTELPVARLPELQIPSFLKSK